MSHMDELELNVRRVAAILGTYDKFRRSPVHNRPGENAYVVEYRHNASVTLATNFAVDGIRFAVDDDVAQAVKKEALLREEYNPEVQESDREFAALLSAGTKYGSTFKLRQIQEEEKLLKEKLSAMEFKVERWLDDRREGGGEDEQDGENTPPTSPLAMSDRSSAESEALTPNLSSLSLLPAPLDKIELSPAMGCPEGLDIIHEYITEAQESTLLAFLSVQSWTSLGSREECQFGYGYVHGERRVRGLTPIPKELSEIVGTLTGARDPPESPNQLIALRYTPPYHLPAHVDAHVFDGTVHSLCLGSGVVLTFYDGEARYDMEHPRRALVTMGGRSRHTCTHGILPGDTDVIGGEVVERKVRYALTFRRVLDAYLPPSPMHDELCK